jgi:hypothetical protein
MGTWAYFFKKKSPLYICTFLFLQWLGCEHWLRICFCGNQLLFFGKKETFYHKNLRFKEISQKGSFLGQVHHISILGYKKGSQIMKEIFLV